MRISDTRLQNFRKIIADKNLRLIDVADLLGKAPAQVSAFGGKNPTKGIGDQIAREIEKALDLRSGYLDMPYGLSGSNDADVASLRHRRLPVLGSIAAGEWTKSNKEFDPKNARAWIDAPGPVGPQAFILLMEGMSMEPKFMEGEMVVIDPSLEAMPGDFVVAKKIKDHAVSLKQLRYEGDEKYLFSTNPDWPERITRLTDDWSICGRACWKITSL